MTPETENYADMRRDPVGFLRAIIDADTTYADFPAYTADAIRLLIDGEGPWRCFHCGEICVTREAAAEHFGEGNYEMEMPLCIEAATLEMKEFALHLRQLYRELTGERDANERLEHENSGWRYIARKLTKKPAATTSDLELEWDAMEGRVLAAEAAINAAPRWLASFLRRRAERLWRGRKP